MEGSSVLLLWWSRLCGAVLQLQASLGGLLGNYFSVWPWKYIIINFCPSFPQDAWAFSTSKCQGRNGKQMERIVHDDCQISVFTEFWHFIYHMLCPCLNVMISSWWWWCFLFLLVFFWFCFDLFFSPSVCLFLFFEMGQAFILCKSWYKQGNSSLLLSTWKLAHQFLAPIKGDRKEFPRIRFGEQILESISSCLMQFRCGDSTYSKRWLSSSDFP